MSNVTNNDSETLPETLPTSPEPVEEGDTFDETPEDSYEDIDKAKDGDADPEHLRLLEAVLFASSAPVIERGLARCLPDSAKVKALLKVLRADFETRGVRLVRRGGLWAFRTAPDLGPQLNLDVKVGRKLSRAAIETLSIIAYHQPVTRGEIEEVRGVSLSKGTLDLLFAEGWIKPRGRRNVPGHPMQWGTTDEFLDHFGLESVKDLPGMKELRSMGLLDARPAIEAYSVSGEMQSKEEAQANLEFTEGEVVAAEEGEKMSDDDEARLNVETGADNVIGDTGGEIGLEHDGKNDAAALGKNTRPAELGAGKLDDAMGEVAAAIKSAAEAIERETADEDDEDEEDGA